MSDHVIPYPEHVISIPLDIEEIETSERNNSTQNHDELPFSTETQSSENEDSNDYYIIDSSSVTPGSPVQ